MKKILLILMFSFTANILFSQNKAEAEKLVDEGVVYHDKGDYEGAIVKYDNALKLDTNNLTALSEKAFSLNALQKFDESIAICKRAIETHSGESGLKIVYVTYGNDLDGLKQTEKSIEIYDQGIKQFPDFYQLYFNRGISLAGMKKYDEALISFQNAVILNPKHASSHNIIARILNAGNRIPSLLAYCRFLIIEPQSKRAKENLSSVQEILKKNVEVTGKDAVKLIVSPDLLGDTTSTGKDRENSFRSTDLLLSMETALDFDEKNKDKTEVEQFIRKFGTVCESLKECKRDSNDFFWQYYVPYFTEMKDNNLIETFAYIAFASSEDPKVSDWLKAHKPETDKFYAWSKAFAWKAKLQ